MKVKQAEIINAYNVTEKLADNPDLPADIRWDIFRVRKQLRDRYEYQAEYEKALKKKYRTQADDDGMIRGEAYEHFLEELDKVGQTYAEIEDIPKPAMKVSDVPGLTVRDIETLWNFIEFQI